MCCIKDYKRTLKYYDCGQKPCNCGDNNPNCPKCNNDFGYCYPPKQNDCWTRPCPPPKPPKPKCPDNSFCIKFEGTIRLW